MTRIAIVEKEKCASEKCGPWLCVGLCPVNRTGGDCITKGEDHKIIIDEELCTGCGICTNRCPYGAISIINLPEQLKEDPIHRYGDNGFALYSLPQPIFGKVVGLIGKNGIGKSTALKILGGFLKPNLSKEDYEASYDDLITHFKGSETQKFFEKLKAGEIKISYKPQNVDIMTQARGTVKELLEKVDEKKKLKEICDFLDITKNLDSDISNLSGGELQRVAIAATALKDANLYVFDEPTSYLDIKQRLKCAELIKRLAEEEGAAVLVIEHDMITLDYMAEYVHIMYGKPACYGIVSQLKSVKAGINIYLDGYLKDENVRFRDKPIKFEDILGGGVSSTLELANWKDVKATRGNFELTAEEGIIHRNDIIGVLGENGIGKTTFVKLLAKAEKADSGEINNVFEGNSDDEDEKKDSLISFKPQYINVDHLTDLQKELQVQFFLADVIANHSNDIIKPLNIDNIFEKKLGNLSGGELQTVLVAKAIAADAKLILLDEPSAYLDIEQRLLLSKVIKGLASLKDASIIVVDHDLVFINDISHKLIVFTGEPSKKGIVNGPFELHMGMNSMLKELDITLRKDGITKRPRINKKDSQNDSRQKREGNYYG